MLRKMSSYAISVRGKECTQIFIALVGATWDPSQMSFILLYGFLHDLLGKKFHAYVCLQEFSPFPVTAITCDTVSIPDT